MCRWGENVDNEHGPGPKLTKLNLTNLTLDTQNDMCSISTSDSDCIVTVTAGEHCPLGVALGERTYLKIGIN